MRSRQAGARPAQADLIERRLAVDSRGRGRTSRTAARCRASPRGPARPDAGCRLHARRRRPGRGGEAVVEAATVAVAASSSARTLRPTAGGSSVDDARRYRPVPPTSSGRWPRRVDLAAMPGRGRGDEVGDGEVVVGSTRSRPWWRTSARSAGVGLAVPMSMPRYTCIASTTTISTSRRAARCGRGQRATCRSRSAPTTATGRRGSGRSPACSRQGDDGDAGDVAGGAATTSTQVARRWCGAAPVISTVAYVPVRSGRRRGGSARACSAGCGRS